MNHSFFQAFADFTSKYPTRQDVIEQFYLRVIVDSYTRVRQIQGIQELSENKIRNQFVFDIQHKNPLFMPFNKTVKPISENQIVTEQELLRSDIEFFISQYGAYVIECKKLKSAEKRYLTDGKGKGGIERFTNLDYAADEEAAGMLGFIVKGEAGQIVRNLKQKIAAFCSARDNAFVLQHKCAEYELSFQSKHIRTNHTEIHLYHLFFDFVNE